MTAECETTVGDWKRLGKGAYGSVHAIPNTKDCVKRFHDISTDALKEYWLMRTVAAGSPNFPAHRIKLEFVDEESTEVLLRMPRGMGDVSRVMKKAHRPGWDTLRVILMHTAHNLIHLHGLGMCHMDLRPANVVIFNATSVMLIDYGCAMSQCAGEDIDWRAGYLTVPERWFGHSPPATANDIYQLGALFTTLCKILPLNNSSTPMDYHELVVSVNGRTCVWTPLVAEVIEELGIPDRARDVLAQTLHTDPQYRPTAEQVFCALHGGYTEIHLDRVREWDYDEAFEHPELPKMMEHLLVNAVQKRRHPALFVIAARIAKFMTRFNTNTHTDNLLWICLLISEFYSSTGVSFEPPKALEEDPSEMRAVISFAFRVMSHSDFFTCIPKTLTDTELIEAINYEWQQGRSERGLNEMVKTYASDIHEKWFQLGSRKNLPVDERCSDGAQSPKTPQ